MDVSVNLPPELQEATLKMIHTVLITAVKDIEKQKSFPPYMTKQEASKYLHVSGNTFDKWQRELNIPVIQIEGVKRYKRSSLDKAMEAIEQ